jgi:signal transduction histidine kinase
MDVLHPSPAPVARTDGRPWWALAPPRRVEPGERRRDAALAALVGLLAVVLHVGLADLDGTGVQGLLGVPVLLAMAAPLAWRRVVPDLVLPVCGLLISVYYVLGATTPAGVLVFLFSLYAATAFADDRREGFVAVVVSVVIMSLSYTLAGGLESVLSPDYLLVLFTFVVAWSLGDGTRARLHLAEELRGRAVQLDALRRAEQADLVAAERRRIARELHDVVSHTVSVVVVQAGAARAVLDRDPAAAAEALSAIEHTGRDALVELRRMLGVLRDGHGDDGAVTSPAPDLASIGPLVASLRDAGLPIELDADLAVGVPAGVALTVHRVVQEGLTNVLRHAQDVRRVDVTVEIVAGRAVVEVVDDGRPAGFTAGSGVGLLGLRERVALHGGHVDAGPARGRGYRLRAEVPLGGGR